jgi:hypothetical protein
LLIVIEPTASGRKWIARVGDREVCKSTSPFVKSARLLLDEGYSADAAIEMWRPDTDDWALQGRLGAVAATVMDGETASRCAKNGSPARDPERGGQEEGCRWFALVLGSFVGRTMTPSNEATLPGGASRQPLRREAIKTTVANRGPAGAEPRSTSKKDNASTSDYREATGFLKWLRPGGPWVRSAIHPTSGKIETITARNETGARDFIRGHEQPLILGQPNAYGNDPKGGEDGYRRDRIPAWRPRPAWR